MIKNGDKGIERYIGGGRIYFTPKGESVEREIGECLGASVRIEVQTADALAHDGCISKKVDLAVKSIGGKVEFTTQNINAANMAMGMLGDVESVSIKSGEKLPDGTTASKNLTIQKIKAGTKPIFQGSIKFVGDTCGDKRAVLVVYNAVITPKGNFNYIADEFQKLEFSGEIMESENGYFDEYRIDVQKG